MKKLLLFAAFAVAFAGCSAQQTPPIKAYASAERKTASVQKYYVCSTRTVQVEALLTQKQPLTMPEQVFVARYIDSLTAAHRSAPAAAPTAAPAAVTPVKNTSRVVGRRTNP